MWRFCETLLWADATLFPSLDKNLVCIQQLFSKWFCVSFGSLFWYFLTSSIFLFVYHFMKCYICNNCRLSTYVTNTFYFYKTCCKTVTVPKQSALLCGTQKLVQTNLFYGKMQIIQIKLMHPTLSYYQNRDNCHPQITKIKPTLIYIFPHSAFPYFNPQQPLWISQPQNIIPSPT